MVELNMKWSDLDRETSTLIKEGNLILDSAGNNNQNKEQLLITYNLWRDKVIHLFEECFGETNIYTREFKLVNTNRFRVNVIFMGIKQKESLT